MELLSVVALHGPNIWAKVPVLEAHVRADPGPAVTPQSVAEFHRRLHAWLPNLPARHGAGDPSASEGDFSAELLAEALCGAALELQGLARTPVSFGRTCPAQEPGICQVIVQFEEEKLGRACLESARQLCLAAARGEPFDVQAELRRLRRLAEDACLGALTGPLVAVALARGIPIRRLDEVSLVQLGLGARQRRIQTAITDRTGKIAEWISLDKEFTKTLLRELGIPVPRGRLVSSAEDAWVAACQLGLPVAVKPRSADYGHGVGLNLTTREQIVAAYHAARQYREEVLVERFAPGWQHRLTVVGDRLVGAVRREPPRLVGDGRQTINQLIEVANRDPRRGPDDALPLNYICPDEDTVVVLAEQGFTFDSVPPAGVEVFLSRLAHTWAGSGVVDVTEVVHPRVAAQCVAAVRLVGLDVAGLDVIAEDISRPLEEQGGAILEVNAGPAIVLHFTPFCDKYQPVCEAIIDSLFPAGETGRIPLVAITGWGDLAHSGRWLALLLGATGQRIGRASAEGLFVGEVRMVAADQGNLAGTRAALLCPQVEAAVLERPPESIRHEGLGFDLCDVAVIAPRGDFGQPRGGQAAPAAERIRAARVLVGAARADGSVVVDADDPAAVALVANCPASAILVASRPDHPSIIELGESAQRAVWLRGNEVVLAAGDRTEQAIAADQSLLSEAAQGGHIGSLLAAVAAAWAMGVPVEAIRARLTSTERR